MFGRRRRRKNTAVDPHYRAHRELAVNIIGARVAHWNTQCQFQYNRVVIKNQRRCWGSCSAKRNLNFSYKLIFLPEALMDYVIVHELCHLMELNHSPAFWKQVATILPEYRQHREHLRRITHVPARGFPSSVAAAQVDTTPSDG